MSLTGEAGVAAGGTYAGVQSAAMGGATQGVLATMGAVTVGTLVTAAVVPVAGYYGFKALQLYARSG